MKNMETIYINETSGRIFAEQEIKSTYENNANKSSYPNFEIWINAMISNRIYKKEKVVEKLKHNNNEHGIFNGRDIL